nr:hypothetical protein [uncultured Dongia sp.]
MPSWIEAQAALSGLGRLLRFDATFAQWFDRSPAGSLRSFGLMIPMVPLFLILRFTEGDIAPDAIAFRIISVTLINYALSWVMFPLILIVIGRAIDREAQAIGAIGCYNWYGFMLAVIASGLVLLNASGILGGAMTLISTIFVLASLVYEAYMLRVLMGIGYGGGALLAILDYVLTSSLYFLLMSPIMVQPPA